MARVVTLGNSEQLEQLSYRIRPVVEQILTQTRAAGWPVEIRRLGGFRTPSEQAALYAQGRTRSGPIVTGLKYGKHNQGLAVDFDLVGYPRDVGMPLWSFLGQWWESGGGRWGGRWGDYGHFEL